VIVGRAHPLISSWDVQAADTSMLHASVFLNSDGLSAAGDVKCVGVKQFPPNLLSSSPNETEPTTPGTASLKPDAALSR
jgi:hypothetical protein